MLPIKRACVRVGIVGVTRTSLALLLLVGMISPAQAADRTVLLENFGGTWCIYCPGADGAISRLLDEQPRLRFIPIRWHIGDIYQIPAGYQRDAWYNITGYPTSVFDGTNWYVGGSTDPYSQTVYNAYRNLINYRLTFTTPVTIDLRCRDLGSSNFELTATIGLESGNPNMNAEVWFAILEDHYPEVYPYWYYRYTARDTLPVANVTLSASEAPVVVTRNFTANPNWDQEETIIVVWVELANAGIGPVQQAAEVPLLHGGIPGDFDGDGDVDLSDFSFFQICFSGSNNPPPTGLGCEEADLDGDGDVDLVDFSIFQLNYTGSL